MDIFGIKKRKIAKEKKKKEAEERRNEALRKAYKERKAHYKEVKEKVNEIFSLQKRENFCYLIEDVFDDILALQDKRYDRNYDSLDEIADFDKRECKFIDKETLEQVKEIVSIDYISIEYGFNYFRDIFIGKCLYNEHSNILFQITNKDIIYVLEKMGFRKHFYNEWC